MCKCVVTKTWSDGTWRIPLGDCVPLLWHAIYFSDQKPQVQTWSHCIHVTPLKMTEVLRQIQTRYNNYYAQETIDGEGVGDRKLVWIWSLMDDSSHRVISRHWQWSDFDLDFPNGNWLHITKTDKRSLRREEKSWLSQLNKTIVVIHLFCSLNQLNWAAVKEFHSKQQQQQFSLS